MSVLTVVGKFKQSKEKKRAEEFFEFSVKFYLKKTRSGLM